MSIGEDNKDYLDYQLEQFKFGTENKWYDLDAVDDIFEIYTHHNPNVKVTKSLRAHIKKLMFMAYRDGAHSISSKF